MNTTPEITDAEAQRDSAGRFLPGKTGNPGGRPKGYADVAALAREAGPDAIAKLVCLMDSEDERIALMSATVLLDRGYGKPRQGIEIDAEVRGVMQQDVPLNAKQVITPEAAAADYAAFIKGQ